MAVKLLRSDLADRAVAAKAFTDEAHRTRMIDHPNVVRILDAGEADGLLYLVMERVIGEDLATRLRRVDALPEGLTGIDDLPRITLELMKRGYSDEDVLKILGGNFLRVFEATEAFARATNTTLSGDGSLRKL